MSRSSSEFFRVKAFSMMDAIIGMVITAIVMGIIFVIFSIVSERMIDYKNQNVVVSDMNRLSYAMNKDIFNAEILTATEREILFYGYTGQRVSYNAYPEYILRNGGGFCDTLHLKLDSFTLDSVKSQSKRRVFQRLSLHFKLNDEDMKMIFYKQIYANQLLQKLYDHEP